MFRKDWLIRQIEMAGRVLASIVAKVKSGEPYEALGMFDEAYQPLVGVGAKLLPVMSDDSLLAMLKPGGVPDANRWPPLIRLMVVEADIYTELGQDGDALARYRKALSLWDDLGGDGPPFDPELAEHLTTTLRDRKLTPDEQVMLVRMYERSGRFDDAEDLLFEALEARSGAGAEVLVEGATAFYRRLLDKDDEALAEGGLPRDEVEASLAEILARDVSVVPQGPE
jgi:hypothetical protein